MENDNQKSQEESLIQVIFHKKNPVRPTSPVWKKVLRVVREIVIWAFWLAVVYYVLKIVAPYLDWCSRVGTWNC
jgi:hypothetical protein